ncbi:MAG: putative ABC transporter permease [Oscillospiraceae bacterium]
MAKIFWYFLIYSFLGFLLEVVFARVTRSHKRDRKCMVLLPLCPVYGLGAVLIVQLPAAVQSRPLLLFLCGALAATAVEYFMDWFYEKALRVRFWDYSSLPWNLNGRVCLVFSGAWGLLSLALTAWVHPTVVRWVSVIPAVWTLPAVLLFLLDTGFTVYLLHTTGTTDSLRWYDRFRRPSKEQS